MRIAHSVDIEFFHHLHIFNHVFARERVPLMRIVFVTIDTFDEYPFSIDKKIIVFYFNRPESDFHRNNFQHFPIVIFQSHVKRVEIRDFSRPCMNILNYFI